MGPAPERPKVRTLVSPPAMSRRSLRPQLNQIRGWVRQGRTDAWIAHQLEVTVQQIQAFKREHDLEPDGDAAGEAAAEAARKAAEAEAAAEAEDEDAEDEKAKPRRRTRGRSRARKRGAGPLEA